ncbi:MAG: cytochrome oxidase [bacterium]|nr:cytochrome oxidase [bacterium]
MDVIIALVIISLMLVIAGLIFFFTRLFEGDFEHGDRLSLLPLADDTGEEKANSKTSDDNSDKIDSNAQGHSAE